jgi:hypothetical protein
VAPVVLDGRQWAFPDDAPLAVFEVLDWATALQPAAERIIRACAEPGETPNWVTQEGSRLAREFWLLHARLDALAPGVARVEVRQRAAELLAYHMTLLDACLNLAFPKYRSPISEARRLRVRGLGQPAEDLRILRDELRQQLW